MTGSHRDGLDPTKKLPAVTPDGEPYTHLTGATTDPFTARYSSPYGPPAQPWTRRHRWVWPVAGAVGILVACMLIALVIVDSSEQQTMVAPPLPPLPDTTDTAVANAPTTAPSGAPAAPPTPSADAEATMPGDTETVQYSVIGTGRAMSITFVDTGNVLQTEFNVPLPWTREVQLNRPAKRSASVSIVNAGHPVACAISVDGNQIQQHQGIGLTICRTVKRGHPY
ncbi:MmpS family transport accessory protein [Mycobacterium sp. OTB74]|uniref:MmpS family transport accessory protein n=1 Tax=Mycobacterium sp. OTB74 TaxID=1853452 RepID=UPI002476E482|nr:MmpS family transport accessory protein [Mycobacterium sp. OTB74]MDH6246851.1 hypothetical protein [Mycobacterium sp. OTB74]